MGQKTCGATFKDLIEQSKMGVVCNNYTLLKACELQVGISQTEHSFRHYMLGSCNFAWTFLRISYTNAGSPNFRESLAILEFWLKGGGGGWKILGITGVGDRNWWITKKCRGYVKFELKL